MYIVEFSACQTVLYLWHRCSCWFGSIMRVNGLPVSKSNIYCARVVLGFYVSSLSHLHSMDVNFGQCSTYTRSFGDLVALLQCFLKLGWLAGIKGTRGDGSCDYICVGME